MRLAGDKLTLSPSDLKAYLACAHLTSLELAVAARRARAAVSAEPVRGADSAEGGRARGCLSRQLGGRGRGDRQSARDWVGRCGRRDRRGDSGRGAVHLPGGASSTGSGAGSRTFSSVSRTGRTRSSTPSSLAGPSRRTCFSSASTRSSSLGFRARGPAQMHVVNGLGEREPFGPRTSSPTTAGYACGSSTRSGAASRPTRTRSTTARSASSSRSARSSGTTTTTSRSSPASGATQVERLNAAGVTTLETLATMTRDEDPEAPRRDAREASRTGRAPAPPPPDRRARAPGPPARDRTAASRSCPSRAPATSGSTSRATPGTSRRAALEYLTGWV